MIDVELVSYQIKELNMVNNLTSTGNKKLVNSVSSDCKWEDGMVVMTIVETLRQYGHPDCFCIELKMEGRFLISGAMDVSYKKEIHAKGYPQLIARANKIVSMLAENSGVQGLDIEISSLQPEDVYSGSKPDAVKEEKIIRLHPKDE